MPLPEPMLAQFTDTFLHPGLLELTMYFLRNIPHFKFTIKKRQYISLQCEASLSEPLQVIPLLHSVEKSGDTIQPCQCW